MLEGIDSIYYSQEFIPCHTIMLLMNVETLIVISNHDFSTVLKLGQNCPCREVAGISIKCEGGIRDRITKYKGCCEGQFEVLKCILTFICPLKITTFVRNVVLRSGNLSKTSNKPSVV